jgi:hypothetical protein
LAEVDLPEWAFDMALYISEARRNRFRNRFPSQKLRDLHKSEKYFKHSESIIGYLGDIAAALLLDRDPVEIFQEMIDATDGLAHRDQFDIWFNGFYVDAKIEHYGEHHKNVLKGNLRPRDPYGCRLINADQWEENHGFTDIYLFGCFDPQMDAGNLLHEIETVRFVGWVTAEEVERCEVKAWSPAGPRLPRPAKIIPHEMLRPVRDLLKIKKGPKEPPARKERDAVADADTINRIAFLCSEIEKIAAPKKVAHRA